MSVPEPDTRLAPSFRGELKTPDPRDVHAEEIAIICHELRNSLAVVRGAARLLRTSAANGGVNKAHALIERYTDQMSRHIDDLLQPPMRSSQDHGLRRSDLDLREIARDAAEAAGAEMTRRAHRLVIQLPEQAIWAHVDGVRLEQAFSNLLINAAKYTPDGGDIALTVECDGEWACVRVRDSGMGIEPAMLSIIFGMFVQLDSGLPVRSGSGIGLAVVRDIIESHGGTVNATSPGLGLGSEFIVRIPVQRG